MNVCKLHEGTVIVYSSDSCPFCNLSEILTTAEQKMTSAIGMVSTVKRALEKEIEKHFLSTLDAAGDFIPKAREEVSGVRNISARTSDLEEEVRRVIEETKAQTGNTLNRKV